MIARAFKEIGLIERYGSGIHRIQKICKNYEVIPPLFEEVAGGFKVVLFNEKLKVVEQDAISQNGGLNGGLIDTDDIILSVIDQNQGIQLKGIVNLLENISQRTIERQIAELIKKGLIERRGSRKTGGYWKIIEPSK